MLIELGLSVVLGFLTSVRICRTRTTHQYRSSVLANHEPLEERALTMQGRFESTKNPVGFLPHEGGILNGRSSVSENTFMADVVAGYIRAVGLNGHLLFSVI